MPHETHPERRRPPDPRPRRPRSAGRRLRHRRCRAGAGGLRRLAAAADRPLGAARGRARPGAPATGRRPPGHRPALGPRRSGDVRRRRPCRGGRRQRPGRPGAAGRRPGGCAVRGRDPLDGPAPAGRHGRRPAAPGRPRSPLVRLDGRGDQPGRGRPGGAARRGGARRDRDPVGPRGPRGRRLGGVHGPARPGLRGGPRRPPPIGVPAQRRTHRPDRGARHPGRRDRHPGAVHPPAHPRHDHRHHPDRLQLPARHGGAAGSQAHRVLPLGPGRVLGAGPPSAAVLAGRGRCGTSSDRRRTRRARAERGGRGPGRAGAPDGGRRPAGPAPGARHGRCGAPGRGGVPGADAPPGAGPGRPRGAGRHGRRPERAAGGAAA